jgi:hypothetical protein
MPTMQEHLRALQKAKAAGDAEATEFIRSQMVADQQAEDAKSYDPTAGNSGLRNLREGIGRGMFNVGRHIGNLVGLESDEELAQAKKLDAPLMNTTGGKIGSFLGETAITAPLLGGAAAGISRAGAAGARLIGNPITRGLTEGVLQGGVMADPGDKLRGAVYGGAVGAALPAALMGGGKIVRGLSQTPESAALRARGIDLTPGQLNPHGTANQMEQAAQSIPVVGNLIKNARSNAEQQFQQAVIKEGSMAPIPASEDIHGMVRAAYESFQPAYDVAKGFPVKARIMGTGTDIPLKDALQAAANSRGVTATNSQRKAVAGFLDDALSMLTRGRQLKSDDLIQLRSVIRSEARDMALSGDSAGRATAKLYEKAEDSITQALASQLPKDAMKALKAADTKYATYKVIENAVAKAKDNLAGLTPAKLSQAISEGTDKGALARGGGGTLRDLARAGGQAFQTVSPATGARVATLGVPAAAIYANPKLGIPATLGMLALTATKTGRKAAAGELATQKAMQRLLEGLYTNTPELIQRGAAATYIPAAVSAQRGLLGE